MARGPNEKAAKAYELYKSGMKLVEIADKLDVPAGTVRRWKSTYCWDSDQKSERSDKKKANARKDNRRQKQTAKDAVEDVMQNTELTDKQRLFCSYYIRCFNATKAYQKAYGVDYNTAASIGYRMLENDGVKTEIHRLKKARLNREFFSEEDVFQKYMDIAFADITDFLSFGKKEVPVMGPFGPVKIKDEDTGETVGLTKIVNAVSFRESNEVDGSLISEVKQGKDGASIKLADRMKALQWLADHMDMATEEQRAKIAQMNAQTEQMRNDSSGKADSEVDDWIAGVMGEDGLDEEDAGNNV